MNAINYAMNNDLNKKRLLIVEDELINREMLKEFLKDSYRLIFASSGQEALEKIHENKNDLSLVLLDLNLPDMNGMDILRQLKEEDFLPALPVIVITSDREAEVESLTIGAVDFIPKPYPKPDVIKARVKRTIELVSGRDYARETEKDYLTGLYSREYFYRLCEQFDKAHQDQAMDAIAINVNHFHMINERYGRKYANKVLKRIGKNTLAVIKEKGGLSCRREADTFLIYCPHRSDYYDILQTLSEGVSGEGMADKIVRIRMGVYPNVDKEVDVERRFDRAKMSADTVRSTFTMAVAIYDDALHESAIFAEQLLIDFAPAIKERQFQVYYQPKYDIRGKKPVLSSAEALVRWIHPEFGMISPAVFIPLFEKNGLIQQLDKYVWRTTAGQIKDWKQRLRISVPVSVNVSRIDMLDPGLVDIIEGIIREFGLTHEDLVLELTESAYTDDSGPIIEMVEKFREKGFYIEMDDFGSGYSSLNMLSDLPIDAIKLDMQFIRSAFKNGKNTRMLEIVVEMANALNVPVVAEGVETAEQLFTLQAMGCDIAQGFYFSTPVPAEKFETFLLSKKEGERTPKFNRSKTRKISHDRFTYEAMHDPLTGLYNHSAFDLLLYDADKEHAALVLLDVADYEELDRSEERV